MPALLVDPLGSAVLIADHEHRDLQAHLEIMRDLDADSEGYTAIIKGAVNQFQTMQAAGAHKKRAYKNPLAAAVHQCIADHIFEEDAVGVLVHQHDEPLEGVTKFEMEILWRTLQAIRFGGWFPTWLHLQVSSIVSSTEPDVRYPAPLKILASLMDDIEQEGNAVRIAREVVDMRPDLFRRPEAEPKPKESRRDLRRASKSRHSKPQKAA